MGRLATYPVVLGEVVTFPMPILAKRNMKLCLNQGKKSNKTHFSYKQYMQSNTGKLTLTRNNKCTHVEPLAC